MAFIGTPLDTRNTFQSLAGKRFSGDGSTTAFTLDVAPSSTLDIEVFVGNVRQDPNSAYTLSGTTLTFTGAPPSGTNNIYVVHQAKSVGTITPGANSVGVTELNLSDGSNGQALTTNGSGTLAFSSVGGDADNYFATSGLSSKDLGTGLHIKTGDSGASVGGNGDELVIEGSGASGLSILSANNDEGSIYFGDNGNSTMGAIVYAHGNNSMQFRTSASERMRIDSSGKVGIGQATPLGKLHVWTGAQAGTSNVDSEADELVLESNGHCGLTIASPQANSGNIAFSDDGSASAGLIRYEHSGNNLKFYANGSEHFRIASDGTLTATDTSIGSNSDSRIKENIADFTYDLAKFKQLQPRTFDWKNPSQHNGVGGNRGFIAQEVEAIDDYWVGELELNNDHADYNLIPADEDGAHKSLTSKLGKKDAMYVSVINQLMTKIETLETEMTALKARVTTLEG